MQAMITTTIATAASMVAWQLLEVWRVGHITLVGTCSGALCGLVAITPAAGYVAIDSALWIGLIGSVVSFLFVTLIKPRIHLDDTLDAFGCHGVSGIWGSIATGLFASHAINSDVTSDGLFVGGGWHLFNIQLLTTIIVIAWTFIISMLLIKLISHWMQIRVSSDDEILGLDLSQHNEPLHSTRLASERTE